MTIQTPCVCDQALAVDRLVPVDGALARIAELQIPLETENCFVGDALERVVSEDILAPSNVPRFDNSAMDGFAVCAANIAPNMPVKIAGSIQAGGQIDHLTPHSAARIFTGAPVPVGADTIVPQEYAVIQNDKVVFNKIPKAGSHIRRAGEEVSKAARLVTSGTKITIPYIATLISAGVKHINVYKLPKTSFLATGNEIKPAGSVLQSGQIWDSNSPMLSLLLKKSGIQPHVYQCPDNKGMITHYLKDRLTKDQVIITSGAASVGSYDYMHEVIMELGAQPIFKGVKMKPGKPVALYRIRDKFILCLPGNPYAAYVTWQIFGTVLINRFQGIIKSNEMWGSAKLSADVDNALSREEYRPATIKHQSDGSISISINDALHSSQMSPISYSNALVKLPIFSALKVGQVIKYLPI